jgi:hypothetical protein
MNIPLGFEIGTGARVSIPLGHTIVLGQTQLSGKTTTLQAMTERSGVCAIAFITKRGEHSFRNARQIPAYFTETSVTQPYWKFVVSMIENTQETRLGFRERGWVMQLCQDYGISKNETDEKGTRKKVHCDWDAPKSLRDVLSNAKKALRFTRGMNELICMQLVEYLKMAVPEIEAAKLSAAIELEPGINVMDIGKLSTTVQALVVRSVIEWVYSKRRRTVVIIPEAWKFLPEGRSTPVTFPVEELIRQGAALQNFVWIDLQDLRGIKKLLLRSIQVWLFGVQREKNEVANTLKSMPTPEYKPSASDMMQLGIGQFIVAHGSVLRRVYVWPAGMEETHAQAIALGQEEAGSWKRIERALDEEKNETGSNEAGSGEADDRSDPTGNQPDTSEVETPAVKDVRDGGVAEVGAAPEEETMWKEKHEALERQIREALGYPEQYQPPAAELPGHVKTLRESHDAMAERIRASEAAGETVLNAPPRPANTAKQHPASNGAHDLDAVYRYIVDRAAKEQEPAVLSLLVERPELMVNVERKKLQADGKSLRGALAILISEKFFDSAREFADVRKDLIRRGFLGSKAPNLQISQALQGLVELGFLTKEDTGYQCVAGMKINILEGK